MDPEIYTTIHIQRNLKERLNKLALKDHRSATQELTAILYYVLPLIEDGHLRMNEDFVALDVNHGR